MAKKAGRARLLPEFIGTPLDLFAFGRYAKLFFNRVDNAYIEGYNSRSMNAGASTAG